MVTIIHVWKVIHQPRDELCGKVKIHLSIFQNVVILFLQQKENPFVFSTAKKYVKLIH